MYSFRQFIEHKCDEVVGVIVKNKVKKAKVEYGLNITEKRERKIIVSMKTYNKRYDTIELVLKSLLLQSIKPDKIIVWLDEKSAENTITNTMKMYEKYGIEYRYTSDDLKSHGKYYYVMQEYPDDIIITVDDDLVYPSDMVASLVRTYKKYPNAVCARRVHLMTLKDGVLEKYNEWKYEYRWLRCPSHLLCATGGGATLYPPHILPEEAFDIEKIKKYCFYADDIWLKVMELENNVCVVWAPNNLVHPIAIDETQKNALSRSNVVEGGNDVYLSTLKKVYPRAFERLNTSYNKK